MDPMDAVQATNNDASECKLCAVTLKYWNDNYIHHFVRHQERKTPEINRGYYARVTGISGFVESFLQRAGSRCQIINLGAGFDTLYWRLKERNMCLSAVVDVDFPAVTAKKCFAIKRSNTLLQMLSSEDGEIGFSGTDLHSFNYHIIGVDLKNLNDLENKLIQCGIDFTLPTLFVSECVLVYIEPMFTKRLLSWIAAKFSEVMFINYEQVNMSDRFGEVMAKNLRERGCSLSGIELCQSLDTQKQRFLNAGWTGARAWDMTQIYENIPVSERRRIESIEFLDEAELLVQLLQHYMITIAWKGKLFGDVDIT